MDDVMPDTNDTAPVIADAAPAMEPMAEPDPAPAMPEEDPIACVRVANHLPTGIRMDVDGIAPEHVEVPRAGSIVVPAAFWEAWRALFADSDFSDKVTATPVD